MLCHTRIGIYYTGNTNVYKKGISILVCTSQFIYRMHVGESPRLPTPK